MIFTPGAALYFDWYQDTPQTQPRAMVGYSPIRKTYLMEPLADTPAKALANEQYILGRRIDEPVEWISREQKPSCASSGTSDGFIGVTVCPDCFASSYPSPVEPSD